jgi:hypothetical protein
VVAAHVLRYQTSQGYTAPGPFRERTLRSLSSCLGLLAIHSLDPTRTSSNVRFRAAVKDIADIKRALIRATSHFLSTRPKVKRRIRVTVHPKVVSSDRGYKLICPTWQETYLAIVADFPLNPSGKSKVKSRHPVPPEGRRPSSRTLGQVAVDAAASARDVFAG